MAKPVSFLNIKLTYVESASVDLYMKDFQRYMEFHQMMDMMFKCEGGVPPILDAPFLRSVYNPVLESVVSEPGYCLLVGCRESLEQCNRLLR